MTQLDPHVDALVAAALVVAEELRSNDEGPNPVLLSAQERNLVGVADAFLASRHTLRQSDEVSLDETNKRLVRLGLDELHCPAHYERAGGAQRGDRIIKCHLPAGHPGEHEEADTEVTWVDDLEFGSAEALRAEQLLAEIAKHPKSALIEALADAMHSIEDDDGNGRHISYYRSLAYATVEILPALFYDEDALCDEPGCGAHPQPRVSAEERSDDTKDSSKIVGR